MKQEYKLKNEVLKMLKDEHDFKNESEVNERLNAYNAYDDEDIIVSIFNIVSEVLDYDYIAGDCEGWGQITFWSVSLQKSIILTQSDSFNYGTLDKIIEAIKSYEIEATNIERKIKK